MYESFKQQNFRKDSLDLIAKCDRIITDYQAQGFTLTLRQLYYQLVSRDIVENTVRSYKRIGDLINNARLAGMLPWVLPADDTGTVTDYEVWVEGDNNYRALQSICARNNLRLTCIRSYVQHTEAFAAAKRWHQYGQIPNVLYFGNYNSVSDFIARDFKIKIEMFVKQSVNVNQLALNGIIIGRHKLPSHPLHPNSYELEALPPEIIEKMIQENQ